MTITDLIAASTADLITQRDAAAQAYYSGEASITDDAFDTLVAELTRRGIAEQVGHGVRGGKVQHRTPMLSLKKVHDVADLTALINENPGVAFTVEPKWDGLAVSVVYGTDGEIESAALRGDGVKGDDVTAAVATIFLSQGLPLTLDGAGQVRGEIVMRRSKFAALNAQRAAAGEDVFSNPHNAAAGMIGKVARATERWAKGEQQPDDQRSKNDAATEAGRWLTFLAYDTAGAANATSKSAEYFTPDNDDPIRGGCDNAPFLRFLLPQAPFASHEAGIDAAVAWLDLKAEDLDVETDGVVLKLSDPAVRDRLGSSSTAPRWALAYKFPNRPKQTILRDVEWSETRTGRVVPTAVFDEVELSGALVTRATLNNVAFLEELDLRIGDTIEVTRANEVIPNVVGRVGEHHADSLPVQIPTGYTRDGRDLRHSNTDTRENAAQAVSFAAERLDILGLGVETATRLLAGNPGITDFPDLVEAALHDRIEPFERGQNLAGKLAAEIRDKVAGPQDPAAWIAAAGVPSVGRRAGAKLMRCATHNPRIENLVLSGIVRTPHAAVAQLTRDDLLAIDGFGDAMADAILGAVDVWHTWDDTLTPLFDSPGQVSDLGEFAWPLTASTHVEVESAPDLPLAGKRVLVTGTLPTLSRKEAQARIETLGGESASSVSKNLDLLIAGEKAGSKLTKAEALGVEVMDGSTFEALG